MMSAIMPISDCVPRIPPTGPSIPSNGFISLPAVPGYVPPELFTNFPPNAPSFFSTNLRSRAVRLVPKPAPQYAVRTNGPDDIYERANFYRDKYPEFVHSIQSLPIAWEDLYTYFDPLDIWMEGAGFCFHVIHRLAAVNIEKRREIESFVNEWTGVNLPKFARVPPNTPVIAAFEPEDYKYFDFENLRPFEVADICNFLAQQCFTLQPQLRLIREGLVRTVEMDRHNVAPPVPIQSGPKVPHQIPWQESPNPDAIGLGFALTRECIGEYQVHRREVSFDKNRSMILYSSGPKTKIEPIYTYTPHGTSRSGPIALTGPTLTAFTPHRDFKNRALPNSQNRLIPDPKHEFNRNRAYSNTARNQTLAAQRYDAALLIEIKTAMPDAQNLAGENHYIQHPAKSSMIKIDEDRSIYIKGFTDDELISDLIPTMLECCGEIEGYKPMKEFAFLTFKNPKSAAEAIRCFNGAHDGRVLRVAPYCRKKPEFDNWNGPNCHRGNSFRGGQHYMSDYRGDPPGTAEYGRTYKTTGRDRGTSLSYDAAQMSRKQFNTPSKRHNMPAKHDHSTGKPYTGSGTTPKNGKGHGSTSSSHSMKTMKSSDKGKLQNDSLSTPTKKGSFVVSEDLSVPEEGKYGTSFSSFSSSFTHKGSIFDESPAGTLPHHTAKEFEGSSGNKECSTTSGIMLASLTPGRSDRPEKKKKRKPKSIDFNAVLTVNTADSHSTLKMNGGVVDADALKSDDLSDANNDDAGPPNTLKPDPTIKDRESSTKPALNKDLTGTSDFGTRAPPKKSTKANRGSPRKLTTDEGSLRSSKKKHSKTDSNTSSFGIETRAKTYEGYELTMNEIANNPSEPAHSESRNQMKTKFFKRNTSNMDFKENTHSERDHLATEVNILADPSHWPSLGEGKSISHIDRITAGQTTLGLLNPVPSGRLATEKRNSMAAIISQKTKIVPVVPLLLRSVTATETRSVSADSAKSDDTIINVANTTGTRLWPAVVKWAGKPPSAEVVEKRLEVANPASCP